MAGLKELGGKMARSLGPEDAMQCCVFDWIRAMNYDDFCWHTANERKCSIAAGIKLKRKGVLAGVSDIIVGKQCGDYGMAFIELKFGKNKTTESQNKFLQKMNLHGYFTKVCYSAEDAINTIAWYLKL